LQHCVQSGGLPGPNVTDQPAEVVAAQSAADEEGHRPGFDSAKTLVERTREGFEQARTLTIR
jgi:hypothetical protein